MRVDEFLGRFDKPKRTGENWSVCCPAHNDKNPSLSICEKDGKIVLYCHAGCSNESIVEAVGLRLADLFADPMANAPGNSNWKIKTAYAYTDELGEVLYENCRRDVSGHESKFIQRRPDGRGGHIWRLGDIRRVPYRLPELIAAVSKSEPTIFICEGEKDADALRLLGLTASSLKFWRAEFNQYIKGAHIVVIRDHDVPGEKQANGFAAIVASDARTVKIIDPFDDEAMPDKDGKDLSDWIRERRQDEGLGSEEILERLNLLIDAAPVLEGFNTSDGDEEQTQIKDFPRPDGKCFEGLAGDFVRLVAPNSEADRMALLSQFLVYFGNVVGRSPFIRIESDRHNTNLFCILVGATGSGRKGTSFRRVKDVFKGIDIDHEAGCHASGLASGEGLVWRVRDASAERKKGAEFVVDDPGIIDKRLLVVEGEFVQVLRVQGREGNTLSGSIRNLWDTGTVQNLTKNSPIKTTDAHVSIIGHITADELHHTLTAVEGANGYANRFLFVAVRRGKFLPFGGELSEYEVAQLRSRIGEAVRFGKSVGQMKLTSSARDIWVREYERLETSRHGYLAKITQRASPYTLRLACIYALLDQSSAIDAVHLESALAFWKYAEDSARYIFGESLGNETAETILTALKETEGGLSRTAIRDLFDRHISKSRLDAALQSLLESNLAHFETQNTGGRKRETWFASSHLNQ